jgi:hypothetical protein
MTYFLNVIVNGHWKPGIGDPTFLGWLITGLYFIASVLCGFCSLQSRRTSSVNHPHNHPVFWWTLTLVMLFMTINKQLDLQSFFLLIGRKVAIAQGWYSQRNIVKIWFVTGISTFSFILIAWLGWIYQAELRYFGLALFGIILLLIFIIIRAGSHHIRALSWEPFGVHIYYILEISSIICIGISALTSIIHDKRNNHQNR